MVTLRYALLDTLKSLILRLIFRRYDFKMSEIIKKLMDKISFDHNEKLTSEEIIEMENAYGAHK